MFSPKFSPKKIKLVSNREACYRSIKPMLFGIVLGWVMVAAGIYASYLAIEHNQYFALTIGLPALVFAGFLSFITYTLIRQSSCEYSLEITEHDAVFSKIDHLKKKTITKFVLLADIKYVEYYPYLDSATIIFHTPYGNTEVALWPMGEHAQDVIDFLSGLGIKIVDVQSDDPIPD